jgi:hypothetical protein
MNKQIINELLDKYIIHDITNLIHSYATYLEDILDILCQFYCDHIPLNKIKTQIYLQTFMIKLKSRQFMKIQFSLYKQKIECYEKIPQINGSKTVEYYLNKNIKNDLMKILSGLPKKFFIEEYNIKFYFQYHMLNSHELTINERKSIGENVIKYFPNKIKQNITINYPCDMIPFIINIIN